MKHDLSKSKEDYLEAVLINVCIFGNREKIWQ